MMGVFHWHVLCIYIAFITLAGLLTLLRCRSPIKSEKGSIQQKSGTYILINLTFLTASWLPQDWHILTILLALISAAACWELLQALHFSSLMNRIMPIVCAILVMSADWLSIKDFVKFWWIIVLAGVVLTSVVMPLESFGQHVIGVIGTCVYLPLCMAAYLWVWHTDDAGFYAVFLFLTVAANDIYAQVIGQLLGKHALVPKISPAKTVEGAIGGILFAAIVGLGLSPTVGWSYNKGLLIGAILGLAGLMGDLSESRWKRALGIKDFSALLGANGGVLDRFDSLIFAAAIFYLILSL